MQSIQSVQNMQNRHAAQAIASIERTLSSQRVLNSQVAKATAEIMQSFNIQQDVLKGQISDTLRISQTVSRIYQEQYSGILRSLDFVRTIQRTMPSLLSNTVSDICSILQRSGFQELADIHKKMIECVGAIPVNFPEIKIDGDRVWIDGEEVVLEGFEETVELFDLRKKDSNFWQQWDSLPRTIRLVLGEIVRCVFTCLLAAIIQNHNATQLDQQQLTEAFREAAQTMLSDPRTLEAILGNLSHLDIQTIESIEDAIVTDDLLESKCDISEENMLKNRGCPSESDHPQKTD